MTRTPRPTAAPSTSTPTPPSPAPSGARRARPRARRALIGAALLALTLQSTALAAPAADGRGDGRGGGKAGPDCVRTQGPLGPDGRKVREVVRLAKEELHLNSVEVKVATDGRDVYTDALGESMTGVPARPDMHFRAGSVVFAHIGTLVLQLAEEKKLRLDDTVERWLPYLPKADRITLRMLATNTSGLHDYVTDPAFLAELPKDPFRQWTPQELLAFPFSHSFWYEPGTSWSYSHANYVLLTDALQKITGTRIDVLLKERIWGPLGLRDTRNNFTPDIPSPVLHAYTSDRGFYEESTFWNPSWTTAPGAVITSHICDLARSAQGIGSGELISPRSYRTLLNPGTVGLGGGTATCPADVCLKQTEDFHFGMGVIVVKDWTVQNPSFSGYAAIQAYLPAERLAIAVSATQTATTPEGNQAEVVAKRIAAALAPDHPL
ncbi:serine hydrolase domain-containing protein [Streptomyces sp. NPDC101118]|uniref:serine hydrolase domain-containing protein n=1 Tax=Streptomyces sp. NPDC101118 TaxID=3366109 RepID=UPI0037F628BB